GVGDFRLRRELLTASPRQQTSELLSAAPGFFVDHEDGEGFGNDIYLRGFDLDHGSGIEMRAGSVPLNIPTHIQGQGYADANLIIPEVVSQIRVLEGPYDPRQGDAAIVGSAYFDLGVPERGGLVRAGYGSFNQKRLVGIWAPSSGGPETFVAASFRDTDGFGQNRAARAGTFNAQYGVDLSDHDHLRLLAIGRAARASLPGVARSDDVAAGRIGFYDSYPYYAENQSVRANALILGGELRHLSSSGDLWSVAPFVMWTDFRARQNYTGTLQSSRTDPRNFGRGDLFETKNRELATGLTAYARRATQSLGTSAALGIEPGVYLRYGRTQQSKNLLQPEDAAVWDRRLGAGLGTIDAGAYLDFDLLLWKRLRLSGGPRVDLLRVSIDDQLANGTSAATNSDGAKRTASGVSVGPRLSAQLALASSLSFIASYGEGYRSLDAAHLEQGAKPYSKVRSFEVGLRARLRDERFTSTVAVFETRVGNELVFVANNGGLESENASVRRGIVASIVTKPARWLLASASLSVNDAQFNTRVAGVSHHVPSVPPILFRSDVSVRGPLGRIGQQPLAGRLGVGYTYASPQHLSDTVRGPETNALNVGGEARWRNIAVGVDVYNALGSRVADSSDVYVSNWSLQPGQQAASVAVHSVAAPPTTVLGSVTIYF
ncbi:MAG TPA: TonB-dependent receptor, partial [Polyangiaceae bacterium]|nr:TonB-dependent receptor [Polyangiaceae bacterium]